MCKISILDKIAFLLVIIGAINWGLIGIFNINLLSLLVAGSVIFQRIIYITVFISSIDLIYVLIKCKTLLNSN
ncbi:DUF378 domain-containing protein [Clostridium sp.]|uniref:DUF378 domain-containing protein n=1 Tax=Clostridium sp. TaxID=1506 RepID=UPI003F36C1A3